MPSATLILVMFAACGQTDAPSGPSQEAVALAIQQLGAREFEVRQQATNFLWAVGKSVSPELETASVSLDPEVRFRASSILDRYRHGIFVDTPQSEVRLINQFRYGDDREQRRAYRQLARDGSVSTLLALMNLVNQRNLRVEFQKLLLDRLESDRDSDRIIELAGEWRTEGPSEVHAQRIQASLRRQVPELLADARFEIAESILLEASNTNPGMRDWAVYLASRGRLPQALQEAAAIEKPSEIELRRQVYLLRTAGDLQTARQVAEQLPDTSEDLLRGILVEARDWSRLAELFQRRRAQKGNADDQNVEALGYAAAAFRLSGNDEQFESALQSIRKLAEQSVKMDRLCGEALLVNYQVDSAFTIYEERWDPIAFEMYCVQERYREAFQLAGIKDPHAKQDNMPWFEIVASQASSPAQSTTKKFELAVLVARTLYQLGEKDQALDAFDLLAKSVQYQRGNTNLELVLKAELRVGLWHRACNRAAVMLAKGKYPDPFATLFKQHADVAREWWEYFTETQSMGSTEALLKIGEMMQAVPAAEGITEETLAFIEAARADSENLDPQPRARRLLALAETSLLHERSPLAVRLLEHAAAQSSPAALKLGDLAAEREDWVSAEKWYQQASELDGNSHLARYLHGHALIQLGRPKQGEPQIELATLLPLANSPVRSRLAAGLKQRGLRDAAIKQWDLILRSADLLASLSGGFRDTALIDATQNFGNSVSGDPHRRTDYWETMHLSCLEAQLYIPNYRGYFHTPYVLHKTRARAFLQQGDVARALVEIETSQSFMPGNIELAEHLVPALVEAGQESAATELFDRSYEFVAAICQDFPDSPLHHNNLAWLCARCERHLDTALAHVRRALELAPDTPSYLDTLGEVHFRRGEFAPAIQCAERCLELDPENQFFRQQLERFQLARDDSLAQ